ncbi:MAG: HAD-IIA family hydrolase [Fimbriimonadaceae bacterium]|nr:HAD-IIA family hydrolase [Fimbriimonadaceae bacterium]
MPAPYRLAIFDLDGTLFRGEEPIPGAVEALGRSRGQGIQIRFLTNNSSQTRETYVAKLSSMGFEAREEEVYSTGIGTATYMREEGLVSAFVVGEDGLKETLTRERIAMTDNDPEAVIVGICKSFSYDLLNQAMQHIRAGARFIATNTDATYPMEGGRFIPGSGSLVAAVRTCTGQEPVVIGKPEPFLVEMILQDAGVQPSDALVVGDRMDTDIEAGRRAGCQTLLVLTGASPSAPQGQPYLQSVADLA